VGGSDDDGGAQELGGGVVDLIGTNREGGFVIG
jgi:hypothetical protein